MRSRGGEVNKRKRRYDVMDEILMAEKDKKKRMGRKETEGRGEEKRRKKRVEGLVYSLRAGDGVKERANQANRTRGFDGSCGLVINNGTS